MATKSERLEARVPRHIKDVLQRAAYARGQTLTDFVVAAATAAARQVIAEEQVLRLTDRDHRALMAALEQPPLPGPELIKAAAARAKLLSP